MWNITQDIPFFWNITQDIPFVLIKHKIYLFFFNITQDIPLCTFRAPFPQYRTNSKLYQNFQGFACLHKRRIRDRAEICRGVRLFTQKTNSEPYHHFCLFTWRNFPNSFGYIIIICLPYTYYNRLVIK